MESSPIKTMSVKLEIIVQKWRKRLFLFALLTRLGCRWSGLQREPQQHDLPSIFYQNEDGNLCLRCCRHSACLFCCCSGRRQSIVCIAHPASVVRVTCGASVMWLHFLLFLHEFFIACFIVVLDILLVGDLRHEYAQSAWGFLFRGPPGCCVCRACVAAIDSSLTMIVIAGSVSSGYSRRSHNAFVAFVGEAALWFRHGSPCRIRRMLVLWALWRFTMMASIASIAISDGFDCAHRNWRWRHCLCCMPLINVPKKCTFGAPDQVQTLDMWESQTAESALRDDWTWNVPHHTLEVVLEVTLEHMCTGLRPWHL